MFGTVQTASPINANVKIDGESIIRTIPLVTGMEQPPDGSRVVVVGTSNTGFVVIGLYQGDIMTNIVLYGPDGQPLSYNSNLDRGVADIRVRQSAATAAGAAVWAIRNPTAGEILYIRKIWMQFWFDGTGAATEMKYEWIKGTGCTAMSGGVAVTPLRKRTTLSNPDVDCRVLDTGLTLTGITQGAAFANFAWARLTHSATQAGGISPLFTLDFTDMPIELVQNEVLSLRQVATSVIGDSVGGGVEFCGG